MTDKTEKATYGIGFRIWVGFWCLFFVASIPWVIYMESKLPFDYYLMIGFMMVCALFLIYIFGFIAIKGRRPGFLKSETDKIESNKSKSIP